MARVLVTGGTGTLGSHVVGRLLATGHTVSTLARHPPVSRVPGVGHHCGDVRTGAGLEAAVAAVDAVVHTATSARASRAVEVDGTAHVTAAAASAEAHLLYISIVGVDQMSFPYYRAKHEAEQVVERGGAAFTILRATQFHDLVDRFLSWRLFPVTGHLCFQPVDTAEVAARLVDLVEAGPSGRVEDFGGPEVVALRHLAATRRRITGSRSLLLRFPPVGFLADFDRGLHLTPDHTAGTVTWSRWLEARGRR